jgi:hypothetical protein
MDSPMTLADVPDLSDVVVAVERMRAVRRTIGGHIAIDVPPANNVAQAWVRVTLTMDLAPGVIKIRPVDAIKVAAALREAALTASGADRGADGIGDFLDEVDADEAELIACVEYAATVVASDEWNARIRAALAKLRGAA